MSDPDDDVSATATDADAGNTITPPVTPPQLSHPLLLLPPDTLVTAGIMCCAVPPGTNQVFFLLAKDSFVRRDQCTPQWSDMSGSAERSDTDVYETAAREFVEESIGVVQFECGVRGHDVQSVAQMLRDRRFLFCIHMKSMYGSRKNRYLRNRLTFVVQVPWQPELPETFAILRRQLCKMSCQWKTREEKEESLPVVRAEWMEKSCLSWWSLPRLYQLRCKGGHRGNNSSNKRYQPFRRSFLPTLTTVVEIINERQTMIHQ